MRAARPGRFFFPPVSAFSAFRLLRFFRPSPEEQLNTLFLDAQRQLADTRRFTAAAVAQEKRLLTDLDDQKSRIARHESAAMEALRRGDEEAARREAHHWSREQDYARVLDSDILSRREAVAALRSDLARLQDRVAEAERKKALILRRMQDPVMRELVGRTLRELRGVAASEVFGLLEELTRPVPDRDPDGEVRALTDPTEQELLEDLRTRLRGTGGQ